MFRVSAPIPIKGQKDINNKEYMEVLLSSKEIIEKSIFCYSDADTRGALGTKKEKLEKIKDDIDKLKEESDYEIYKSVTSFRLVKKESSTSNVHQNSYLEPAKRFKDKLDDIRKEVYELFSPQEYMEKLIPSNMLGETQYKFLFLRQVENDLNKIAFNEELKSVKGTKRLEDYFYKLYQNLGLIEDVIQTKEEAIDDFLMQQAVYQLTAPNKTHSSIFTLTNCILPPLLLKKTYNGPPSQLKCDTLTYETQDGKILSSMSSPIYFTKAAEQECESPVTKPVISKRA